MGRSMWVLLMETMEFGLGGQIMHFLAQEEMMNLSK